MRGTTRWVWGVWLPLLICLTGCATYPRWNRPLAAPVPGAGYRFSALPAGDNSDNLFVVLTFSGGGTRAAALAFGVLEKLRDTTIEWEGRRTRLLDEVDVISSVSGGSLTSAYYGLFGDRIFDDFPEKVLYKDVQGDLIRAATKFGNYVRLASPFFGRTDLLAEQLNYGVFGQRTFADLVARGRRPFIVINATDLTLGLPFRFTQDQFDLLYSDLSAYPIGNAVAASAAFPGLLTPMTLWNYTNDDRQLQPGWVQETLARGDPTGAEYRQAEAMASYADPQRRYIHLVDGGVSDNLGMLPVIQSIRGTRGPWTVRGPVQGKVRRVVIIAVNAERPTETNLDTSPEVLGLFAVLGRVSTIPLGNFSDAQIEYLQLLLDRLALTEPDGPRYSFVQVAFSRVSDAARRSFFASVPTSFKLPRETVDALRAAAGDILDAHPVYQSLCAEFRPAVTALAPH